MRYLDLTLPTPEENLALDEALLEEAEATVAPLETLRTWEARQQAVIIGRSSRVDLEVHEEVCRQSQVPVLRRVSGGAAVVIGPGCLMYALVLDMRLRPKLRAIDEAHAQVLGTIATALRPTAPGLAFQGTCDLTIGGRKCSGNSVRCKREHLLYHGTLLYDFPLDVVGRYLTMPPRQPAYRQARPHEAFVANLPLDAESLRSALQAAWVAHDPCQAWPAAATARLVAEKYSQDSWNFGVR